MSQCCSQCQVAIVDYGVGNLFSLCSALDAMGVDAKVTADPVIILNAPHVILPGVGAFGDAIAKLRATGLVEVLDQRVALDRPLLGICLGMQLLFEKSFEYGEHEGLGYLPGQVVPFEEAFAQQGIELKVPHMGWNTLDILQEEELLAELEPESSVYFVHSYYASTTPEVLVATAEYGVAVPATVRKGNICGCQFHPEKSGAVGLKILKGFLSLKAGE